MKNNSVIMKNSKFISVLILTMMTFGCSTMNSDFSCNATAVDRCMTIDQVNAMTEGKTKNYQSIKSVQTKVDPTRQRQKFTRIWIAPWTDSKGGKHQGELVYAPHSINEQVA